MRLEGNVSKNSIKDILPLTPMQESMLFQYLKEPGSGQYFEQIRLCLDGEINMQVFTSAWEFVAENNEVLRTVFKWDKLEQPVQVIMDKLSIPITVLNLEELDGSQKQESLGKTVKEDISRGIDIEKAPFRITLCRMSKAKNVMIISNHHILYDGWSNGILINEFMEAYESLLYGNKPYIATPKYSIKEYLRWLQGQDKSRQKKYWQEYLQGFDAKTEMPLAYKKFNSLLRTKEYEYTFSSSLAARIINCTRTYSYTPAEIFYAAWGILLRKYNNSEDVIFGTTISGRNQQIKGISNMAGLFVNTLPLRLKAGSGESIRSVLGVIRNSIYGREDFECTSLSEIKLYSELENSDTLFDSIIAVENYPIDEKLLGKKGSVSVTGFASHEKTNFDLTIAVLPFEDIKIKFIYNSELFTDSAIEKLLKQLEIIIDRITENPDLSLDRLEILSEAEKDLLINKLNDTASAFPKDKTLQQLFEEQAAKKPDSTALRQNDDEMSYGELNSKANRIAAFLRNKGVVRNSVVGLMIERSFNMITAILGILKAGGAYLPIDPSYPKDRITAMLNDSGASLLIAGDEVFNTVFNDVESFNKSCSKEAVLASRMAEEASTYSVENPECVNSSEDCAYVMYTSGSAGKPKGILTSHYNVGRVVKNTNYIEIQSSDVILQLSNYAFDGSTFDIFGALLNGAALVLTKREILLDIRKLSKLIRDEGITVFFITTALFNTLADLDVDCMKGVRKVLFGGERVSLPHVRKALESVGKGKLIHVYGPTETTTFAAYYPINEIEEDLGTVPIGRPISNTEAYVLDRDGNLSPLGCPGELYISGDGVAKGYLNRPELSKEKFLRHPFKGKGLVYRTGDLVKMLPDGNIVFLDRMDGQVKLRGFRVELGEIESRLLSIERVKEAVVTAREDQSGNKYLCSYITAEDELKTAHIREELLKELPDYMIPAQIVFIEEMPLTQNGKVDKRALSKLAEANESITPYEAPSNYIEEKLESIWREVLGADVVGVNDNFFDLGGHSLKATVLAARIHKLLGVEVPLAEILRNTTVRKLAGFIQKAGGNNLLPIPAAEVMDNYPASSAQKRLFVQQYSEGIDTAYNIPIAFELRGSIDAERLISSLKELVNRHEALRTSFELVDGSIVQKVSDTVDFSPDYVRADGSCEEAIKDFIKPFDLGKAPLFRARLVRLDEQKHLLLMDLHHIISDGVAVMVMLEELAALYDKQPLEAVRLHYKDFSVWQEEFLNSDRLKRQKEYWIKKLSGDLPVLNMPLDYKRLEKRSFTGSGISFEIPAGLRFELERMSRQRGITLNNLLMSMYFLLLNRYTGQEDLIIGSLVAGRRHPDTSRIIGMFNNYLPMRLSIASDCSVSEFLNSANEAMLEAYENQEYPFDMMVDGIPTKFDQSRNPLFDTMLILHNQLESFSSLKFGEALLTNQAIEHNTSKLDFKLDVYMSDASNGLKCIMEYNDCLFKRATVERMAEHLLRIMEQAVRKPHMLIGDMEVLTAKEKEQLLGAFNDTKADYPKDKNVCQLFEEQVMRTPDKTAVIFGEKELTYYELYKRAGSLASALWDSGVGGDTIVGIIAERSIEMIVGILAVLKAGGAYLPISPDYPPERQRFMLEDSGAGIVLTQNTKYGLQISNICKGPIDIICLDDESLYNSAGIELEYKPEDMAYVIYTSGSTGTPKGVMIEHYSLVNRLKWMQKAYPIGERDMILQKTPYTFDVSVWELFWWAVQGAAIYFLAPGGEKDPETIVRAIEKRKITTMHFVPSMLSVFLSYIENTNGADRLKSLRQVFASGEALKPQQVNKFNSLLYKSNGTRLINLYGPTEATVDVSYFDCASEEEPRVIPIGKPIDNIRLYILDNRSRLQPVGIPGELHIAGDGLARGYLNRAELTAEKFIADPFAEGERMYKTGDLAKWLPDGNIEYLGRMDNQIKVRGFRIELGEIEAELLKHASVREAAVVDRLDSQGEKYLCAYFVLDDNLPVAEIREHLSGSLPDYMIPSFFVKLDKMPLTPNGKADRKALPEPEGEIYTGRAYMAPTNEAEEKMAAIWKEVLGIEKASISDSFFELGGHSLKAVNLAAKIHKEFGINLPLGEIFNKPVLKDLTASIQYLSGKTFKPIARIEEKEYYPVSSSQKRMYILNRLEPESTSYNLSSAVIIEGELELTRLENAFDMLVERHEGLRTSFRLMGEEPVQIIHADVRLSIEYSECRAAELNGMVQGFIRPFDLGTAPLIRAKFIKTGPKRHLLIFDMHHIIADGVSSVILVNEFTAAYSGKKLDEQKIRYRDFAAWQNKLLTSEELNIQKEYWRKTFNGGIPVLNLPADYARPSVQSTEGAKLHFGLGNDLVAQLKKLALKNGATFYMVMLALYNTLLYRYTGQEDIVTGSPTAGRRHADLDNVIGMFVNTLALRNYPEGNKTFFRFLEEVKENALKAYENQDYQFEKLVEELEIPRDAGRNPLFDSMFVLQNMSIPQLDISGLRFLPYDLSNASTKFDLTFEVIEGEAETGLNIEYCTRLYRKETIERMAKHFVNIAEQVILNPDIKLCEIEMLSRPETAQIHGRFNNTSAEYPKDKTIYRLFEEQAVKTPNAAAVIFEDGMLTYNELNSKANGLARALKEKGVRKDSIVGMLAERSAEMAVGIMAVLKAGGAYLPISPDYPLERIKYMLEDSGAKILLVQNDDCGGELIQDGLKELTILKLDDDSSCLDDASNLTAESSSNDMAYVIYTSGSTGKPKGVVIEHYSLVNRLSWMQKRYPIMQGDVILQKTPYTFDVSVWELLWWSMQGASVCFLKPEAEKDPEEIVSAIERNKVTTMHFVPSMLNAFLDCVEKMEDKNRISSLRQVFASGEALNLRQVTRFNKLLFETNGTKLHNLYGPTEAAIDVSYFDCSPCSGLEAIPIGKPIDNICLYILNPGNKLQPVGVPGELHISGDGLARGYLNKPELTAEKFIPNPFKDGGRLYKTGDLAKWLPDGNIEYLGRIDNQVKLRGFRIELGEIEAELLKHPEVKEAVVAAKEDTLTGRYLCAYFVSERELTVGELREHLSANMPEYMLPSYFIKLDKIPLSASGKADRKSLPAPEGRINTGREFTAPVNEVEEKLLDMWKEVLGLDVIGTNDRFFELGGTSLLLIRLHEKIDALYPGKVKVTDIFVYSSIAALAEFIQKTASGEMKKELDAVEFPQEYFEAESKADKAVSFKMTFAPKTASKLTGGLTEHTAEVMLSAYVYLISGIAKQKNITIQTLIDAKDTVYSLKVNFDGAGSIDELINIVGGLSREKDAAKMFTLKNLKRRISSGREIIPLFCKEDLISSEFDTLELFDIALELSESSGNVGCILRFNEGRMNKDKMKEFSGMYIKLAERFLEE